MTEHQQRQVLDCVAYYMKHDLRERVMMEVPEAYNAWMGKPVVGVFRVCDGSAIEPVDSVPA